MRSLFVIRAPFAIHSIRMHKLTRSFVSSIVVLCTEVTSFWSLCNALRACLHACLRSTCSWCSPIINQSQISEDFSYGSLSHSDPYPMRTPPYGCLSKVRVLSSTPVTRRLAHLRHAMIWQNGLRSHPSDVRLTSLSGLYASQNHSDQIRLV
jgi:hypothetical protein